MRLLRLKPISLLKLRKLRILISSLSVNLILQPERRLSSRVSVILLPISLRIRMSRRSLSSPRNLSRISPSRDRISRSLRVV